ncbi:MAG: hypothetical protein KJ597_05900 [Nanoarchaeota archaeon]|nr:hypothetical protein [Patescibacteria group bacterium]MBU1623079.1 hypothetical protein [Nanoarchaeota archaeon]
MSSQPLHARLESGKRRALEMAMDVTIPLAVKRDIVGATRLAIQTLEDIREGNNPDLEPAFREKMEELGIELDN